MDKVDWTGLCQNPNAIHIIKNNLDKVYWNALAFNDIAIELIENNSKYNNDILYK